MNQPSQRMKLTDRQPLLTLLTFGAVLTFPFLLSSCAQFKQLMGMPAESTETAQPAPAPKPASPATVTAPSAGSASHQNKSTGTGSPGTKPALPATIAQPAGPDSMQAHDKAVAEKNQQKKDKKASAASDKKSAKKPSTPEARPQPDDAFLPPIPLPSKPAAIGGSGG